MKRSIISFFVFISLVILGVLSEFIYLDSLADEIKMQIQNYSGIENCEELKELFEQRKSLNRIFLRENIIERFELYLIELENYTLENNGEGIKLTLDKIKYFTDDLYKCRTF